MARWGEVGEIQDLQQEATWRTASSSTLPLRTEAAQRLTEQAQPPPQGPGQQAALPLQTPLVPQQRAEPTQQKHGKLIPREGQQQKTRPHQVPPEHRPAKANGEAIKRPKLME